jgi:hypothetical protein
VLLVRQNHAAFAARIKALAPDSRRLWGTMDVPTALRHLRCTVDVSLGKFMTEDKSTFLSRTFFCFLVFRVLPWPKGKIKAPGILFPAPEGALDVERQKLLAAMDEFIAAAEREPGRKTLHPMFGPQPLHYWARIHGKHFDHHFRQFGV